MIAVPTMREVIRFGHGTVTAEVSHNGDYREGEVVTLAQRTSDVEALRSPDKWHNSPRLMGRRAVFSACLRDLMQTEHVAPFLSGSAYLSPGLNLVSRRVFNFEQYAPENQQDDDDFFAYLEDVAPAELDPLSTYAGYLFTSNDDIVIQSGLFHIFGDGEYERMVTPLVYTDAQEDVEALK